MIRRLAIILALAPLSAMAQEPSPPASWFADHSREREAILRICREYPGPAERDDRCKAAFEGAGLAAAREAHSRLGDLTPPSSVKYWLDREEERREHLATCGRVPADVAARLWCAQAREAEQHALDAERRDQPAPAPAQQARQPRSARRT